MAHKKGQGSTNNGRESQSKRLGVKLFGGQTAIPGNIIVRQRGTRFHPGAGVGMGKDHTIFAKEVGLVTFTTTKNNRKYIHVLPEEGTVVAKPAKKALYMTRSQQFIVAVAITGSGPPSNSHFPNVVLSEPGKVDVQLSSSSKPSAFSTVPICILALSK